ncbi:NADH:flavin oxidoreductase [Zavarzinia compransoris]|uniref:N-methylproline demethylase n=1 Tax=Zavarzinia compransoris TaxID=1264899 RepID=A0A317DTT3_9PROT|nr:NADH:flavin oxidoreductase [Zavarzinia compransoris]PWR18061.1 N-methylproline demethylase [Zavarzinia compransoris]TDP43467.1 2,4-dienoyl-CoA reductase-like NADH-dependent reductase (Old Yellow Enzyme family) [Zavarzinia compransoris]
MIAHAEALLKPLTIKGITIRNRVMSTSHAPGYGRDGKPQERYQLYHAEKARGGIGLTMFGGSSSVSLDSPATPWNQISVADDSIIPWFRQFADRVHGHGARLMIQLTHMGRRTRWDTDNWFPTVSASTRREPASRTIPKILEEEEIARIVRDYAEAARRAREGGLDGIELSAAHGHLVDQFWAPDVNRRADRYGGALDNRMRFGIEVLEAMRAATGDDFVIGMRMSADELLAAGLSHDDCLHIAGNYAGRGLVDFLNILGGNARDHMAHAVILPNMSFPVAPFVSLASAVKREVDIPVFHAQRVTDLATAARIVHEGHVDMVAMTRAHIADPHLVRKLAEGREDDIRQCVGAGYCIDRIYVGGDALCLQNAATGREAFMPHVISPAARALTAVVVGAGPAGLEAARVLAERGHRVVLFEKDGRVGGQINLAARAGWREALSGIPRWLLGQVTRLGVDLRLNTAATPALIAAEAPEVVIVATGGVPGDLPDHAASTWDVLSGRLAPAGSVLLYDETGQHQGASVAEAVAKAGCLVELATHDRMAAEEVGTTNQPVHLRELYRLGVIVSPNLELVEIYPEGNRKVAVLRNTMTGEEEERLVDHIIVERGTLPVDGLYFDLKPRAVNRGQTDQHALVAGKPQPQAEAPGLKLYRIGDAVAGRNIHAALYDALRLCKDI